MGNMDSRLLPHHFYVAIYKNSKLYFVSGLNGNKVVWEKGKDPYGFKHSDATNIADGLVKQGHNAFVLQSLKAIKHQGIIKTIRKKMASAVFFLAINILPYIFILSYFFISIRRNE